MKLFALMAHINVGMFLVRFVGCHIKRTMLALALVPSQHEQHWIDGLTFPRLELFKWFEWPVWELWSDWSWNLYRTDQSDVLADILGSKRWMHLVNCWYRLDRRILMRKRGVSTASRSPARAISFETTCLNANRRQAHWPCRRLIAIVPFRWTTFNCFESIALGQRDY